jgi:hypothetical protein
MEETKSVFISSCTRRDLARRRAGRPALRLQLFVALIVLAAALAAFLALHGGV